MALVGVELETLVSKPDALNTRPLNATCKFEVADGSQALRLLR